MTNLNAQLIRSNADEVTAIAEQHPALVRLAKLEAKSQSKPGTRIKVRAGMYLYTANGTTYEISEEQNSEGEYTGNWKIEIDCEIQHMFTIKTLKDAIATINNWETNS